MDLLWSEHPATVREVLDALNLRHRRRPRAYTTVMTTMVRLADQKGLLRRTRVGRADVYEPALSREEYHRRRAEAEVGALVDEFGEAALVHFARRMARLDPERQAELTRLAGQDPPDA